MLYLYRQGLSLGGRYVMIFCNQKGTFSVCVVLPRASIRAISVLVITHISSRVDTDPVVGGKTYSILDLLDLIMCECADF